MSSKAIAFLSNKSARGAAVILAAAFCVSILFPHIASLIPKWLVVNEPAVKSDLIIVLNGQNIKGRILHGVSLYRKGIAPKILLAGMSELEHETGIYLRKLYVASLGVPESAVDVENFSRSTYEDALQVQDYLEKHSYQSFILVTSPSHTRRSKILFKRAISSKYRWSVSCDPAQFDFEHWWKNVMMAREVFYEYLALPYCLLGLQ